MSDPGPRVRVTGPPRRRTVRGARTSEIDAGTPVGAVFMRSLLREQLRLARRVLLLLVATVGVLPLVFAVIPAISDVRPLGVPLPWILLGVLVYPWLVTLGLVYVRTAEANERDFAELMGEVDR